MSAETRLISVELDEASLAQRRPEMEHELSVAIQDLLAENSFAPLEAGPGPYALRMRAEEQRLVLNVTASDDKKTKIALALQPLKRTIRDYMLICESYYEALTAHAPNKLEAIDMGRRGLHNEGAEALKDLLEGKITVDFCTARRLFTLICVLHMK